jgi:predicted transcriptional regulator
VRFYTVKGILELPAFLTVEEAARILRLKRSTAYEYVRRRGDSFSPP